MCVYCLRILSLEVEYIFTCVLLVVCVIHLCVTWALGSKNTSWRDMLLILLEGLSVLIIIHYSFIYNASILHYARVSLSYAVCISVLDRYM
jgi:hypothetical protein